MATSVPDCSGILRHQGRSSLSYKSVAPGRAEGRKAWCLPPFIQQFLVMSPFLSHHYVGVIIYSPQERLPAPTAVTGGLPTTQHPGQCVLEGIFHHFFVGLLQNQTTVMGPVIVNFIFQQGQATGSNCIVKL